MANEVFDIPIFCRMNEVIRPPCWEFCRGLAPTAPCCQWAKATSLITDDLRGDYRIADNDLDGYELYRGVDAAPDLAAAPWETFASLPHTTAALTPGHTYQFVLRLRNVHNMVSQNTAAWSVIIAGDGSETPAPPSAPANGTLDPWTAGAVRLTADYFYLTDDEALRADSWLVYLTSNGVDPNPAVDTPTEIAMVQVDGVARLDWTSGTFADGLTIKALIRTRRSGTPDSDSTNLDILSTTSDTDGPAAPAGQPFIGTIAEQVT